MSSADPFSPHFEPIKPALEGDLPPLPVLSLLYTAPEEAAIVYHNALSSSLPCFLSFLSNLLRKYVSRTSKQSEHSTALALRIYLATCHFNLQSLY